MKHLVARAWKAGICFFLILSLCGCWNSRELDTLGIVLGVGVDLPEGPGNVKITVQMIRPGETPAPSKSTGAENGMQAFWNLENTGETVFDAIRAMSNLSSRKPFFPHNEVLIFSERIAEQGIQEYIDFFARDPETRDNVWVLVSEEPVEEILNIPAKLEKIPAEKIAKLVKNQAKVTAESCAVKLRDFSVWLMSETTAPVMPLITAEGEGENRGVKTNGTAVFKQGRMVGKLDKFENRGRSWVLGEVNSCVTNVWDAEGNLITLETIRAKGKATPEVTDDRITMKIEIKTDGNIGEYTGYGNPAEASTVAYLEQQQEELIRNEILTAFEKAKELDADIFGFGEEIHRKYPKKWKELKGNWDEIFRTVELDIHVEVKLRITGRINNPPVPQ